MREGRPDWKGPGIALAVALMLPLTDAAADITATTRWADPNQVRLDVEFPGDGYHASWELFRCDCGDLLVQSELNMPGNVQKGESLLVGGRAVLSRGFAEAPELGSSLDAPALMMQLALRLLERAEPGGPGAVIGQQEFDIVEEVNPILLQTYAAKGGFQAPWSLSGWVAPAGDAQRRFDLHFEFTVGVGSAAQRGNMRLVGRADFADHGFPLADSDPLQGWTLTWRDGEDPAATAAAGAQTLAELRKVIQDTKP